MSHTQDLVVPAFKSPVEFSPMVGAPDRERHLLAFFRGDMGQQREPQYSRGIRQRLHGLALKQDWHARLNISVWGYAKTTAPYSKLLASAVFCFVLPSAYFLSCQTLSCALHYCSSSQISTEPSQWPLLNQPIKQQMGLEGAMWPDQRKSVDKLFDDRSRIKTATFLDFRQLMVICPRRV